MKMHFLSSCFLLFLSLSSGAQSTPGNKKLKVFIDCSDTWCDMTFIRSEINIVDFMLDPIASDVHVLITSQNTGSGGNRYQLIFFGQNHFKNLHDTVDFNTDPNQTNFEVRDLLLKYLKLGLAPFVAKTDAARDVTIIFKKAETGNKDTDDQSKKDPWNYWVYRIGVNGDMNADAVYKENRFSGNISANRTTEDLKLFFGTSTSANKSVFEYEDSGITQKIIVKNHNYDFHHYLIKSLDPYWSWGYETRFHRSSFSNYKGQILLRAAIEYDIFPYSEVNTRYFTVSYGFTFRRNRYFDTTIYDKIKETLLGHRADANMTFNQKWGTSSLGISYQNYFHNWKLFNLGVNAYINFRITGGLSFNVFFFGGLTRDQIYLPRGGASEQEILTRRRQIASGYNISTSFGLNYRFGSKVNNFVNPRFEGGG